MNVTVSSGKEVFFTKLLLVCVALAICYYFLSAIAFFGFFIALNLLAIFYIIKMNISEEAERLGRKGNAILGFIGMLAVQVILLRNSNFVDVGGVNMYVVEAERKDLLGYGILMIGASVILFIVAYNIVRKVMEEFPIDPPPGLLYAFTATSSLGSALLMYGFFFSYGTLYVDISPRTFLEIRVKEAGAWLVIALFAMYFFMGRLKFKSGESVTVYFFGRPVYSLTGHRDLMVPVLSAALHFITELANQHPIGFSVDFKVLRRDLPRQESNEIVIALPGEQKPVRLDGGDDGGGGRQVPLLQGPNPTTFKEAGIAPSVQVPPPPSKSERSSALPPKPKGPSAEEPPLRIGRIVKRGDELRSKEDVAEEVTTDLLKDLMGRGKSSSPKAYDPTTTADFSRKKPPKS